MTTPHPYPAYKPSGVPWLGDVPQHWDVVRLASVSRPKSVINQESSELLSVYLSLGVIRFSDVAEKRTNPTSQDLSQYQAVDPGDLVLNNQQAWRGSVGVSSLPGIVSPAYLVLALSSRLDSQYANLLFRDNSMVGQYVICSKGVGTIQRNLYWPHLKRMLALLPPLPEQRAIVRYLDYVDRRIRRYVASKRKLIGLLDEEKQAIINRAVTRGLDPNVCLKPSGVEWLGDVPEHWEVPRLRNLGDALIGLTYDPQDVVDEGAGILVLRASNILDGQLVYWDNVFVRSTVPDKLVTREGDILICSRSGSRTLIGKNAHINTESAGTTFGAFMTVFRGANNDYLHLVFNSKFFEYQSATYFTSTINQLTLGILYDMKVPFPPLEERQLILRYVEETTAPINKAIARARTQIELLEEYRTRLIADVATGKLDVREVAAQLPEEPDDQDRIEGDGQLTEGMDKDLYDADASGEELAMESEVTV